MKKLLLTPLIALTGLALIACTAKTTERKTTPSGGTTTKTNTTTKDPNPIPKRYRITKEIYDSYFNQTVDQFFELNLTVNETSVWGEGDSSFEIKTEYSFSKGKLYTVNEGYDTFTSYSKEEDGSLTYVDYECYGDSWEETSSGTTTAKDVSFTFGVSFDYSKLTFDLDNNVYKSDEVLEDSDNKSSFEYSNFIIKFDDNKPISLSYHMKQTMHRDGGEDMVFIGDISLTISNIGTTEVISPFDRKYIVARETFDTYFNIKSVDDLLQLNYTLNNEEKGTGVTFYSSFVIDKGHYLINEYTYYEMSKSSDDRAYVYSYHYDKNTHTITTEGQFYQTLEYSVYSAFRLAWFNFDEFKFNDETKAYECDYVKVDDDTEYYDIKVYFEDNIIQKYTYTDVYTSGSTVSTYQTTKTFSNVGTTTINISE